MYGFYLEAHYEEGAGNWRDSQTFEDPSVPVSNKYMQLTHLILTPLFPPSRFGGIEKIAQQLAEGLKNCGDDVIVFSFASETNLSLPFANHIHVERVDFQSSFNDFNAFNKSQKRLIETVIATYKNINDNGVIHAHDWFVGPAALSLREILKLPLLTIFHSDKNSEYGQNIDAVRKQIHYLQKCLAYESDTIYCYSRFMKNSISISLDVPEKKINLFRCGHDEGVRQRIFQQTAAGKRIILYLGRLAPEKDVKTLIAAFYKLTFQYPHYKLRIVGSGSEEKMLKHLVKQLSLNKYVTFLPFTSNQKIVERELLNADVLVLPSIFEPFGMVILEAISRLLPVVVPNCGGPAEVIKDGITGWCFTPGDSNQLADKIALCLNNMDFSLRMALIAFEDTKEYYRWQDAVLIIRETCLSLISRRALLS